MLVNNSERIGKMIKPPVLKKGDTIGVISPASPSESKSEIIRAQETLENMSSLEKMSTNRKALWQPAKMSVLGT